MKMTLGKEQKAGYLVTGLDGEASKVIASTELLTIEYVNISISTSLKELMYIIVDTDLIELRATSYSWYSMNINGTDYPSGMIIYSKENTYDMSESAVYGQVKSMINDDYLIDANTLQDIIKESTVK